MGCDKKHILDLKKVRIDHIDQDTNHNCPLNLRLVCNAFNVRRRQLPTMTAPICMRALGNGNVGVCTCGYVPKPAPVSVDTPVSQPDQIPDPSTEGDPEEAPGLSEVLRQSKAKIEDMEADKTRTATMRKNDKCEKPFNKWLNGMLDAGEAYTYDEYANAGAFSFECSLDTIKRYLNKRLDLPDCNPINGDLTLRLAAGGRLCVAWKDRERWFFK